VMTTSSLDQQWLHQASIQIANHSKQPMKVAHYYQLHLVEPLPTVCSMVSTNILNLNAKYTCMVNSLRSLYDLCRFGFPSPVTAAGISRFTIIKWAVSVGRVIQH
jgi:hypothetical protein